MSSTPTTSGTSIEQLERILYTSIEERKNLEKKVDALVDRVDELEAENERLREQNAELESKTKAALRSAHTDATGEKSKTQVAVDMTRNILVTKVANGCGSSDRPVTISRIQDKASPDYQLAWSLVDNAWGNLQEQWPQFYETKKNGQKALSVRPDEISPSLAYAVQTDLGRDDLAKRFVGDKGEGGH